MLQNIYYFFGFYVNIPTAGYFSCRLYCCTISGGKCFKYMRIYSGSSIGECQKKSLRLYDMNCAPFFALEMLLFKTNLVSIREEAGDPG